MKILILFSSLFLSMLVNGQTRYNVSSASEFNAAQDLAIAGDSIVWLPGTYYDTRIEVDKDGLTVTAQPYGTVLFTGASRAVINGDDVTLSGIQYIGGNIANLNVINSFGSDALITHINIQNYTSHKYLVVDEVCRNNTISYCNFENRLNGDDKNILSILVDDEPGYHKIQYCSFKNFDGIGADQGIEPIRIGVSSQGHLDSRTLVEYCYFTQCNGDGEIISHKSRQNVYRYNTFENNPLSELVLRHGDEGIIYGNFFLNNRGGIRIREGSDHFIYNNYFQGIQGRALWLMNDPVDPLVNVHIYHNTFVDSEEIRLGGSGNNPPTNVTIAKNVFFNPLDRLFIEETGNEAWMSNFSFGNLGIDIPSTGLSEIDPQLFENPEGFFQPESNSPVISSSSDAYPAVPLYDGMDYDYEISLDLMKESRSVSIPERAIGASEYSPTVNVQPHATEINTGPSYLFDNVVDYLTTNASQLYIVKQGDARLVKISSNMDWTVTDNKEWISTDLSAGSGDGQLIVTIAANEEAASRSGSITITSDTKEVTIDVFQDPGDLVSVMKNVQNQILLFPNPTAGKVSLSNIPFGQYLQVEVFHLDGRCISSKEYRIDDDELVLDFEELESGPYLLNIKVMSHDHTIGGELTRKFVKN